MKVKQIQQLEHDFSALTSKNSPLYDHELMDDLIQRYGSIEKYKKSKDYHKIIKQYGNWLRIRQK